MAAPSRLVLLIGGVLVVGSLPAHAMAGVPVVYEHEKFSVTFPDEVCGIPVITVIRGVDTFRVFDDGTSLDTAAFTAISTAESGGSVTVSSAGQVSGLFEPIENPDGTITIVDTFRGMPEKVSITGGSVLYLDAGTTTLTRTWTVDENGELDELIPTEVSGVHGPHPGLDSNFELFCDVVEPALT